MTDVDSRIASLLENYDVLSRLNPPSERTFPGALQTLLDILVVEETADLNLAIVDKDAKLRQLGHDLLRLRKDLANTKTALYQRVKLRESHGRRYFVFSPKKWRLMKKVTRLQVDAANDALAEMARQDAKWGPGRQMPNGTGAVKYKQMADAAKHETDTAFAGVVGGEVGTWRHILAEEYYEALAESNPRLLKEELNQVASVCLNWIVSLKLQKKLPRL